MGPHYIQDQFSFFLLSFSFLSFLFLPSVPSFSPPLVSFLPSVPSFYPPFGSFLFSSFRFLPFILPSVSSSSQFFPFLLLSFKVRISSFRAHICVRFLFSPTVGYIQSYQVLSPSFSSLCLLSRKSPRTPSFQRISREPFCFQSPPSSALRPDVR